MIHSVPPPEVSLLATPGDVQGASFVHPAAKNLVGIVRLEPAPGMRRQIALPHVAAWLLTAGLAATHRSSALWPRCCRASLSALRGASLGTASRVAGGSCSQLLPGTATALRTKRAGDASPRYILVVAGSVFALGAVLAPLIYRLGELASIGGLASLVVVLSGTAHRW